MNLLKKNILRRTFFPCLRFALIVLFGIQALALYFAQRELELPDFLRERIAEFCAPSGARLEIDSIKVLRLSRLSFSGLRLFNVSGTEQVMSAKNIYVHFDPLRSVFSRSGGTSFFATGIELACPAALSETASSVVVFTAGRANFLLRGNYLHVAMLQGKLGETALTAYGDLPLNLFFSKTGEKSVPAEQKILAEFCDVSVPVAGKTFYATLASIAKNIEKIKTAQEQIGLDGIASVDVNFDFSKESNSVELGVSAFCKNYTNRELDFSLDDISASQSFDFNADTRTLSLQGPVRVHVEKVRGNAGDEGVLERWNFFAEAVDFAADAKFQISASGTDFLLKKICVRAAEMRAKNFSAGTFAASALLAEINSEDFFAAEKFSIIANAKICGVPAAANIEHESGTGTLVAFSAPLDLRALLAIPQVSAIVPADVKKLEFTEPPMLLADVRFGTNFEFLSAAYELKSGPLSWRMVDALSFCSDGFITPDAIKIRLARLIGETYCTNVRVFSELKPDGKYRIQAFGSIENPEALDDYLGWFWWRIWNNIKRAPSPTAPRADIDVYGTWGDSQRWENVYGSIVGENALGGGVLVDKVRLRVAEEPNFIAAFDMGFLRAGNLVTGTLQWHYAFEPEYHFRDFRCSFSGTMPPHDVFKIVGEGLPEAFSGVLERDTAGTADVRVFFSGAEKFYPQVRQMVEVDVRSAPGAFSFLGIRGENFRGKINYDSGNVNVDFSAENGGGKIGGNVHVNFPEKIEVAGTKVALDLHLENVPGTEISAALSGLYDKMNEGTEETAAAEEEFSTPHGNAIKKPDAVRVSANFAGNLTLPEVETLVGDGNFHVSDPELFDLQIFGDFSRLLETIKIPLTSFAFTDTESDFSVADGNANLPNLQIYGASGEISANVSLSLVDKKLFGRAIFKNRRFTNIPLIGAVVGLMSNSTNFLPIEVSGTLDDMHWILRPFSIGEQKRAEQK